jgi:hypothetical protein
MGHELPLGTFIRILSVAADGAVVIASPLLFDSTGAIPGEFDGFPIPMSRLHTDYSLQSKALEPNGEADW